MLSLPQSPGDLRSLERGEKEQRVLKVLKVLAELYDLSLGDLLEGIVLHAFEGQSPFDERSQKQIQALKQIYGMDYDSSASHRFTEDE